MNSSSIPSIEAIERLGLFRSGVALSLRFFMLFNGTAPRQDALRQALEELCKLGGADHAALSAVDERSGYLQPVASAARTHPPLPAQPVRLDEWSMPTVAYRSRTAIVANSYTDHPLADSHLVKAGIKAALAIPVVSGHSSYVLTCFARETEAFNVEQLHLLIVAADALASCIDQPKISQPLPAPPAQKDTTAVLLSAAQALRAPVKAVLGYADLLLQHSPASQQQVQWLTHLHEDASLLQDFAESVEELAKLLQETAAREPHPLDVKETVTAAVEKLRHGAFRPEISLVLPSSVRIVLGDAEHLRVALMHLVRSAGHQVLPAARIQVLVAQDVNNDVRIDVICSGKDEAGEFTGSTADVPGGHHYQLSLQGAGLHLSIARAFLEPMGAQLATQTTPHGESSFSVTLPAIQHQNAEPTLAEPLVTHPVTTGYSNGHAYIIRR